MRKAERWTVLRKNRTRKPWCVYAPGHLIGGHVYLYRRFETWEQAIDHVFDEGLRMKRQQSLRARLTSYHKHFHPLGPYTYSEVYATPDIPAGTPVRVRVNGADVGVEPWHGQATGQAS